MTIGNLPSTNNNNPTTKYFNNFFTEDTRVGSNINDAILGYFQSITGNKETGRTLAGTVIYTALTQGIDPMSLLDEFKKLSDQTKIEQLSITQSTGAGGNVYLSVEEGLAYQDKITITGNTAPRPTQTLTINLTGKTNDVIINGYEVVGTLTSDNTLTGNVVLIGANYQSDSFVPLTNVATNYGLFTITSSGSWNYTRTAITLPRLEVYEDTVLLTRQANLKETQQITFTIDNTANNLSLTKIKVDIIDDILPRQIVGGIQLANIIAVNNSLGTNKFGRFTVESTGLWYYLLETFAVADPNATKGPSPAENNLNEVDAYLTVLLNTNRVNTSLLGISNTPPVNKYIQRSILP